MTATSIAGRNWNCTRRRVRAPGAMHWRQGPVIRLVTLTVNVAANAAASVTNTVTSGRGETNTSNDQATDVTILSDPQGGANSILIWATSAAPGTIYAVTAGTSTRSEVPSGRGGDDHRDPLLTKGRRTRDLHWTARRQRRELCWHRLAYTGSAAASGWQQVNFPRPVAIRPIRHISRHISAPRDMPPTGTYSPAAGMDKRRCTRCGPGIDGANGLYTSMESGAISQE